MRASKSFTDRLLFVVVVVVAVVVVAAATAVSSTVIVVVVIVVFNTLDATTIRYEYGNRHSSGPIGTRKKRVVNRKKRENSF